MKEPVSEITLEGNLKAIREQVDVDLTTVHIDDVVEHGKRLAALMGLSAECMAAAQRRLQAARLKAIKSLDASLPPSVLLKMADAEIGLELALYEYADRLNAALTHQLDFIRTVISKYKVELETSTR